MKKILATLLAAATLAGCYDEYVKDYDYSGVYIAYQYDLRTFVVGEGMKFTVGSVLAGVMDNERDRSVYYALDDELVTGDLAPFNGLDELGQPSAPFTAFDVMSGKSTSGTVSQSYVTTAVKASGIKELTPLPREYFTVSDEEKMTIRRGRHTGTITVRADSAAFLADAKAGRNPYYAVGFRITSADADTILLSKSFEVIAVRYENKLFGNYYHGGETQVVDARGEELSKEVYPTAVPSDEGTHGIYTLTTDAPDALTTNYIGTKEGSVRLTLDGKEIRVSGSVDGSKEIEDLGSRFNDARLLQNRKLFLHYADVPQPHPRRRERVAGRESEKLRLNPARCKRNGLRRNESVRRPFRIARRRHLRGRLRNGTSIPTPVSPCRFIHPFSSRFMRSIRARYAGSPMRLFISHGSSARS